MAIAMNQGRLQDENLQLHDGTSAITADALGTVGGAAASGIVDIGDVDSSFEVMADVTACDVAGGDEEYRIQILGSDSSSFASGVVLLGEIRLGDTTTLAGGTGGVDTDKTTGRHFLGLRNRIGSNVYRYVRCNFEIVAASSSITVPNVAIVKLTAA